MANNAEMASVLQTTDSALDSEGEYGTSFQRVCLSNLCVCRFLCALSCGVLVHAGTDKLCDRRTV